MFCVEKPYKDLSAHVRHQWSPYHSNQGAQSQVVPDLTINHNKQTQINYKIFLQRQEGANC